MATTVFAVHSHPDDIEFTIAGTLFLLRERGCEIHYMNIANGSCGTAEYSREEIIRIRRDEGIAAAEYLGATFHESLTDDMEVLYELATLQRLASVMRAVGPDIVLTASPQDYMEDHMNACRLAVSAAFTMPVPNYPVNPPRETVEKDVTVYHAMPHGLRDGLRNPILPDFYVDVTSVMEDKARMLAYHASQKNWLDRTQGFGSYIDTMRSLSREVGTMSGRFEYAEGWRRHSHLGFSRTEIDPLADLLGPELVLPRVGQAG
ncbi:MAG: LmbE family protein [Spirochaetaceae bacterium]|nr:MAG: LmbE family protein [Spirochaetaceae bacterium]